MDDGTIGSLSRFIFLCSNQVNSAGESSFVLDLIIVLLLILLNGFFAASEMAVVTLNDNKVRKLAEEGNAVARKLLRFVNDQGNFLATIQVGVTFAGFLSSSLAADKFATRLYAALDPSGNMPWLATASTVGITLVMSYLSLVLGELVPKRLAMRNPEAFTSRFVGLLRGFDTAVRPFSMFVNFTANIVLKLLRVDPDQTEDEVTEEEIRLLTEVGRDTGNIRRDEAEMIKNVFAFDDKDVSEIMTPRTSMTTLSVRATYDEAESVAANDRYSRIPVYDENVDNIVGILHIKDLFRVPKEQRGEAFDLRQIIRDAYFVPEGKSINMLFREMQREHISLAVVVDEYGGTDGIISIEDLLEEIVGNIEDEYDEQNPACITNEDGSYSVDGLLTPEEAGRFIPELDALEDDDDYDTLAGFVLSLLERIPEPDEHPSVTFENLRFTVLQMDDRRIARIHVEILPEEDNESD